jgi:hypothetical protein
MRLDESLSFGTSRTRAEHSAGTTPIVTTLSGEEMKPLAIDLFCGLGGWTEGLLAEGYRVVGFDIERHQYGDAKYPAQLVLQDVLTIHGAQFKHAALIVASPPCQGYSYRAMPWKRAKALPPPDNSLFEACFRIQQEASEAAGRYIPLVVENVRGAQKWVGRSRYHFGSFHLWGDVPALMPITKKAIKVPGFRFDGSGKSFQSASVEGMKMGRAPKSPNGVTRRLTNPSEWRSDDAGTKNGGDWFASGADCSLQRRQSSKSLGRKAASAAIAKIPLVLSRHIAQAWKPESEAA